MIRFSRMGALLAATCAVAASVSLQPAFAADEAPTASSVQIESVVVTAERRSEKLQDVPVAVSVVSADELKATNFSGLTDLQFMVPSVQYNAHTGGGFQIRGVGTQSVNLSTEQDVGIVIDDVVQGIVETNFAAPSYQALTDIERVEVLKGPQGTLFGKNSSVGVLQIITKKPVMGLWSLDGSVSYGTDNEVKAEANANIPLGEDLAARLSVFDNQRDGYIRNVYTGKDISGYHQYGTRGKLLWKPNDDLSVYLIGGYVRTSDTGNGALTLRSCGSGFAGYSPCASDIPLGIVPGPKNRKVALDGYTGSSTSTADGSLHIDYQIGNNTLTSVTAYIRKIETEGVDVDSTPRPILSVDETQARSRQFTQELRLSSPSDQFLEYTVGAFYYRVDSTEKNVLAGTFGFLPDSSTILLSNGFASSVTGGQTVIDSTTTSYAAYGQATAHITDQLSLIGGLRYTHDEVTAGVHINPYPNICEFGYAFGGACHTTTLPSPVVATRASASNVSGKVTVKYDINPDVNVYATFATGYKGPAISYPPGLPQFTIKPETSKDYEIGMKSQLFDRRVVLNIDAFYEKYSDFQGQTFVSNPANPGASNFVTANAGGLESKGVEADLTWMASEDLTLSGSLAWTPTKYTEFAIQCQDNFVNPATIPGQCTYIPPGSPAGTPNQFNAAGYPLPQAPKFTYSISANYRHSFANGYSINADANWNWRSSSYTVVANPNTIQQGYGLLGVNVGVGPEGGRWRLSVFARNLLDQNFASAIFPTYLDNGSLTGIALPVQGYANVPNIESSRTVGVRLDFNFGD